MRKFLWTLTVIALLSPGGTATRGLAEGADGEPTGAVTDALTDEALLRDPATPVVGNPGGDVTIVEFFDYQCPTCKQMHGELRRLMAEDRGIRVVLKDWPVFGPVSVHAAKLALASRWQGKYEAVHEALLTARGPLTQARVRSLAEAAGVDLDRLDRDLATRGGEIDALLARTEAQAEALEFTGTPTFLIGPFTAFGHVDLTGLRQFVSDARQRRGGG